MIFTTTSRPPAASGAGGALDLGVARPRSTARRAVDAILRGAYAAISLHAPPARSPS